jgi:flagellar biosynthetic protein FlhB
MDRDRLQATLEPTAYRLRQAREEGRVARSSDLASVLVLIVIVCMGFFWLPKFITLSKGILISSLSHTGNDLPAMLERSGWQIVEVLFVPCLVLTIAAACAGLVQVGGLFAPNAAAFNMSRMSVASGWSRILGARAWMQLLFSTSKLVLATLAAGIVMVYHSEKLLRLGLQGSLEEAIIQMGTIGLQAVVAALGVLLVLGVFDFLWQRHAWKSDLKMTRQEIIDEYRDREGRGHGARRHAAWIAKKNTVTFTPSLVIIGSDVVISIRWNATSMSAPIVLDMKWGDEGEQTIKMAKSNHTNCVEDHALARLISKSSDTFLGIPPTLHGKIAGLLLTCKRETR